MPWPPPNPPENRNLPICFSHRFNGSGTLYIIHLALCITRLKTCLHNLRTQKSIQREPKHPSAKHLALLPHHYQPAVLFTHPHTYPQCSSNYTEACAATQSAAAESENSRKLTTLKRGMQSLAPVLVVSNTDASEDMGTRTSAAQKPKEWGVERR